MAGRDPEMSAKVSGEYFSRWEVSCGRSEADWAVVKERTERAVRPLVRDAKQDFRVLAEPMRSDIWVTLRMLGRSGERDVGSEGPERTRDGRVHSLVSRDWEGGGPITAPSMNVIGIGSGGGSFDGDDEKRFRREERRRSSFGPVSSGDRGERRLAIRLALFAEMALRST
jgi:hypothetical protein